MCLTVAVFVVFFTEGLATASILHDPETQSTLAGGSVGFFCSGLGEVNLYVDDQLISYYTDYRSSFEADGFSFTRDYFSGGSNLTMTAPAKISRNGTKIQCIASGGGGSTAESAVAWLWIVGPPLAPNVSLELVSWNAMRLSWDAPFTAEGYPIVRYIVYTTNTTTGQRVRTDIYPSTGSETHTILDSSSDCHTLQFEVFAESSAGLSTAGQVSGGFPVAVSEFGMNVSVMLLMKDLAAQSLISFHLPDVCSDSGLSLTYIVELKNSAGGVVQRTRAECQQSLLIEETVILDDCDSYTVNVTAHVPSYTELGSYTTITPFNISFICPPEYPSSPVTFTATSSKTISPSALNIVEMQATIEATPESTRNDERVLTAVLSIASGILLVILLTAAGSVVIILLFLLRTRKTVDKQRVRSSLPPLKTNPMYDTGSPVYDVIADDGRVKPQHIRLHNSPSTTTRYLSIPSKGPVMLAREDSGIYDTLARKGSGEDGDGGERGCTDEQKEDCYILMQSHVVDRK